jgi:hypothetical protein
MAIRDLTVDNRDLSTTWLSDPVDAARTDGVEEGIVFEVDPWDLVENAIENAGIGDAATANALDALRELRKDVEKEMM